MSEKTEQPTEKKQRDARAEGQVAKSADLTVLVQLAVILGFFAAQGSAMYDAFCFLIDVTIRSINLPLDEALIHTGSAALDVIYRCLVPMFGMLAVASAASIVAQTGFVFAPKALKIKGAKLNPLANAKQLFSGRNLFEFGKSVLKVTVLTVIFYFIMKRNLGSFQFMPVCGIECGMRMTGKMVISMLGALICFYLFMGTLDFAFQKYSTRKQMMMSKEEIKQEHKNSEGNPEVKHERKRVHHEIQSGSLASNVKKSTAVVRNPTHIAICLHYEPGVTPLPCVLEKGEDAMARHIVSLAQQAGVPVIENIPVARALNAKTERGGYIPVELFGPVAEILRAIEDMSDTDEEPLR